jgi:hypothetical protein
MLLMVGQTGQVQTVFWCNLVQQYTAYKSDIVILVLISSLLTKVATQTKGHTVPRRLPVTFTWGSSMGFKLNTEYVQELILELQSSQAVVAAGTRVESAFEVRPRWCSDVSVILHLHSSWGINVGAVWERHAISTHAPPTTWFLYGLSYNDNSFTLKTLINIYRHFGKFLFLNAA